jgi:hypothetical protein
VPKETPNWYGSTVNSFLIVSNVLESDLSLLITYPSFDRKDLYFGHITNHHKKRKFHKSVRRNYFAASPINNLFLINILNDF